MFKNKKSSSEAKKIDSQKYKKIAVNKEMIFRITRFENSMRRTFTERKNNEGC